MSTVQHGRRHPNKFAVVAGLAAGLLMVSACGGPSADDDESSGGTPTITYVGAGNIPVRVAIDQGFYDGVNVEFKEVGEEQETSLFIGGDAELGAMSPWSVAKYDAEGEDIRLLSSAGSTNLINGVLVRAEDADKYQTIADLEGKKLGVPGFGSDTWAAFETVVKSVYGDEAKSSFDTVTADSGALLGLLGTDQIDGALLTSGSTATGMALPQFKLIFSFTQEWQEAEGQPLIVDSIVAKGDWVQAHPDLVQAIIDGNDKSVEWMGQHPEEFDEGGQYADLAKDEGWLEDPKGTAQILDLLKDGKWYLRKDSYTQDFVDSMYKFVQDGQGIMTDGDIPAQDKIFYPVSD